MALPLGHLYFVIIQPNIWPKPSQNGSIQGKVKAAKILHLQPKQIPDLNAMQMMSMMGQDVMALITVPAHTPQVPNILGPKNRCPKNQS